MEHRKNLYKDWLGAFAAIGSPAVSRDTAARILAVVYVHGNNEAMVYNQKFLSDVDHIKRMYHINGGDTPDPDVVMLIKNYVKELELYRDRYKDDPVGEAVFHSHAPEWAKKMFLESYGVKLIN